MTRRAKLLKMRSDLMAARLGEMTLQLDCSVTTCECCGRENWTNRDDFQLARELNATVVRPRRHAEYVNGIISSRRGR